MLRKNSVNAVAATRAGRAADIRIAAPIAPTASAPATPKIAIVMVRTNPCASCGAASRTIPKFSAAAIRMAFGLDYGMKRFAAP